MNCADCDTPLCLHDGMEWPDDGTIRCWECQHKLLRFLESRFRCCSPQMDGDHRWRFDNSSWPIQHLRGPTIDDAIRNMMEAIRVPSPPQPPPKA